MTAVDSEQTHSCPACGQSDIDHSVESFDGICENCGLVIREDLDSVLLDRETTNKVCNRTNNADWKNESRVQNATEQQIAEAFEILEEFADALDLPNKVREATADLYCDAFRVKLTDGRKTACVVAACLRLASRDVRLPIPGSRLTEFTDVDEKKFHRSHLVICDELDLNPQTPEPPEYLDFLQLQLGLNDSEREIVEGIVSTAGDKQLFVGKDPAGIAAGGVYLTQETLTQGDVATAVGLSTETVRQRIKQLRGVTKNA